jgi:hypothetical protein
MDAEIAKALVDVMMPVVTALAVAFGGWIVSKMPGPLRDVMTANVHAKDVAVLVGALQRRAMAEVTNHHTPAPTAEDLVAYLERIRPDLLAKMQVAPEALATMAQSAIASATVAIAAPVSVSPSLGADVLSESNLSVALHRSAIPGA